MKFPLFNISKIPVTRIVVLLMAVGALVIGASAQRIKQSSILLNDSASLSQCRNGAAETTPPNSAPQCIEGGLSLPGNQPEESQGWATGNAGSSDSHWNEKDFIAYRMEFGGLTIGSQSTVVIGYDIIDNGKHAIDYLGSYNFTETDANPCPIANDCPGTSVNTTPVPPAPDLIPAVPQVPGVFTFFGAAFNGVPQYIPCPTNDDIRNCVSITFTPEVANPVLAWGGHIAWRGEWGAGQSAGGINGSPYHMRLIDLNGSGGNQDRSLSANAVAGPASLRIIKSVTTFDGGGSTTVAFNFETNRGFTPANFSLVDDDAGLGVDNKLGDPISNYNGTDNVITVVERTDQFPVGGNWSFESVTCVVNGVTQPSTFDPTLVVTLAPESVVVCTYHNTQLTPSAAPASISGRVSDPYGNGLAYARVDVLNASTGEVRSALTNGFGYYTIDGLGVGEFYMVTVSSKRYSFASQFVSLEDNVAGLDFTANPE
ncbi:MAG TPA: carboxypeptidase-like regulatory domain-containing protein [Pyrinomonadaceae bacterium]|nr:carboxypeptidase-like regulatory domain-containing protein [Pyrinomonadaceae bacterium]